MKIILQTIVQTPEITTSIDLTWVKENNLNIFTILSENDKLDNF